jgi:hypothetical protein
MEEKEREREREKKKLSLRLGILLLLGMGHCRPLAPLYWTFCEGCWMLGEMERTPSP